MAAFAIYGRDGGGVGGRSWWVGRVENLDKARQVVVLGSADQLGIERGDDDDGVDEKLD